jgi:MFS family permease
MLLPMGAAVAGTLVLCLSLTYEPWQFYGTFIPARALAETLLTGVVPMTAATNWFYLKRPRAIGLVALSVPLGSFVLSLLYQFMIATYGWRSAFMMLGVALWLFVVLQGLFFLRRQPEDMGMLPDGAQPRAHKSILADGVESARTAGRCNQPKDCKWTSDVTRDIRRVAALSIELWLQLGALVMIESLTNDVHLAHDCQLGA